MSQIWKYELQPGENVIEMPSGATILSVGSQSVDEFNVGRFHRLMLWALVIPDLKKVMRTFCVVGTGENLPHANKFKFYGTAVCGTFVWHVFEDLR